MDNEKQRADLLLVARGLTESRAKARAAIEAGLVKAGGREIKKPSELIDPVTEIALTARPFKFVGRGGDKLEYALSAFNINVSGMVCVDVGASTGGFTDCLLTNQAKMVYAVDVGHGQLDARLLSDERVAPMEGTDIRSLKPESLPALPEFASVDVSFISLSYILKPLSLLLSKNGSAVCLIKPQFEAGRAALDKRGVVRAKKDHARVLEAVLPAALSAGFYIFGLEVSPIKGGSGNTEYLMYLKREAGGQDIEGMIEKALKKSFGGE